MTWMIRSKGEDMYWSDRDQGGWVEVESATVYDDGQHGRMQLMPYGEWVELWSCDGCGENMPCDTGEGRTAPFTRQSIDPPETVWICEACVGNREAAEETRAEALREQYYELK